MRRTTAPPTPLTSLRRAFEATREVKSTGAQVASPRAPWERS